MPKNSEILGNPRPPPVTNARASPQSNVPPGPMPKETSPGFQGPEGCSARSRSRARPVSTRSAVWPAARALSSSICAHATIRGRPPARFHPRRAGLPVQLDSGLVRREERADLARRSKERVDEAVRAQHRAHPPACPARRGAEGQAVLVHCNSGGRSAAATSLLERSGYQATQVNDLIARRG